MQAKIEMWVDIDTREPMTILGLRDTLVKTSRLLEYGGTEVFVGSRLTFEAITFEEYCVVAEESYRKYPNYRRGQSYFNVLYDCKPALADTIRGGVNDPFYRDEILPKFLTHVADLWEEV